MQGELEEEAGGRWRVRFVRRLRHPRERVWRALTEPEHLAAWFPTTVEGERAAGASLRFAFPGGEQPAFEGEMVTWDPPSVLEFRWGEDLLRFELHAAGEGTVLTLLDTLAERGKAARDAAGWHVCLNRLERYLSGAEPVEEKWRPVHAAYVERFGPEASTIGPPEAFSEIE
ncbi:MAG: hypothetical protein A2W29_14055 [Gemmatimonadetes bacterium RBG_16_66_8]|nr:MAG: hypothetical protein A2W29_14055 [Gemmatimonadetes bacterium RBG_16_66_8]